MSKSWQECQKVGNNVKKLAIMSKSWQECQKVGKNAKKLTFLPTFLLSELWTYWDTIS